ncbi:MAG: 2,3-dihydroxy-p-cumate/2,3-dihydroxybenzoate 3,4-dioxygenase [Betaproteobacteria bacterium]|jgi:catechol 2,3-dioxygenase-like lactoylglutathione lyase family enzyme|nr:2,3-dihydroxy-p-cumate/2,3-dihydroxybenzoate 3,4-dioxygenase [Betaproteobacteria bacterium]
MRLQSVDLRVPDVEASTRFFAEVWGLVPVSGGRLRGSDALPYLVGLEQGEPAIRAITFCGADSEREVKGPEGETYRFVREQAVSPLAGERDRPIRLSHVVLNSADVDAAERFATEKLGFRVSDRTRHMTFLRCNRVHHCIAYARAGYASLNHVAFEMADVDGVMRGIGRLRDAGYPCVWGPGRHGPGNNVFGYFVGPHGGLVEYTSEVSEVGDDYRVGAPEDWKWPPGRIDQWGLSAKDTARTNMAERAFTWK